MIPSPYNRAAPNNPIESIMIYFLVFFLGRTKAINARIPPSPSLSALKIINKYFMLMTRIKDQKIKDKIPKTFSSVTFIPCGPAKQTRIAYKGLVPISPKTIPKALKASLYKFEDDVVLL